MILSEGMVVDTDTLRRHVSSETLACFRILIWTSYFI